MPFVPDKKRSTQRNIKAILGWSGGLDSTYALWYLLNETSYKISAHHVYLIQKKRVYWEAERLACKKIKDYIYNNLPDHRDVNSISFSYSYYESSVVTFDQDILLFMLSQFALAQIDDCFVAYGVTKEDYERWTTEKGYYPGVGREIFKVAIQNEHFVHPQGQRHKINPDVQFIIQDLHKKEIYQRMPKQLAELSWSCRNPIPIENGFKECQECRACKERASVL